MLESTLAQSVLNRAIESSRQILLSRKFIWLAIGIALILRCCYALREPLVIYDDMAYRQMARMLVAQGKISVDGEFLETYFSPVPALLIAPVYWLGGSDLVVRELWAVLGALAVWAAYAMTKQAHGLLAGNLVAIGTALYPYNILTGGNTTTDIINILLVFVVLFYFTRWLRDGSLASALLGGLSLGLATFNRPANFVFVPIVAGLMCLFPRTCASQQRITRSIAFVVLAVAIVVPWSIRNSRAAGKFCLVTSSAAWVLWEGNNPWYVGFRTGRVSSEEYMRNLIAESRNPWDKSIPQTERDDAYLQAVKQFFRSQSLWSLLRYYTYKTIAFWQIPGWTHAKARGDGRGQWGMILLTGVLSYVPLLVFSVIAIAVLVRRHAFLSISPYVGIIVITFVTQIWFASVTRYRFIGGVDDLLIVIVATHWAMTYHRLDIARQRSFGS